MIENSECFHSYKSEKKFEDIIEPRKIMEEKDFQFPQKPSRTINIIYAATVKRGWLDFYTHARDSVLPIVQEFNSNMLQQDQHTVLIRKVQVPSDLRVINIFYHLPSDIDCPYFESITTKKWVMCLNPYGGE